MAFLDNSGDILLDAVLTDTGRKRMAEGTFNITKFALGDEEIDYSLYNYNDSRGTAYYDTDILSTPILEATTDNAAGLKTKLLTIGRTNLWYLPVLKLQTTIDGSKPSSKGNFYIPCDTTSNVGSNESTTSALKLGNNSLIDGVLQPLPSATGRILLHQGIDNDSQEGQDFPVDLFETQFLLEIDNRLGKIRQINGNGNGEISTRYIDDDQIAAYIMTNSANGGSVKAIGSEVQTNIAGSRGNLLQFSVFPSESLTGNNNTLFTTLGDTVAGTALDSSLTENFYYIDSFVRITGLTTGFRIDIPVRFLKKQ